MAEIDRRFLPKKERKKERKEKKIIVKLKNETPKQ